LHTFIPSFCARVITRFSWIFSTIPSRYQVGRLDVASDDSCGVDRTVLAEHLMSSDKGGEVATSSEILPEGGCVSGASEGSGWAAVIAALHWIESPHWNGKFAIVVVANDSSSSTYPAASAEGNSQGSSSSSGGSGAVALLLGRNAPLVIDLSSRTLQSRVDTLGASSSGEGEAAFTALANGLERCYTAFAKARGSQITDRGTRGGVVASSANGKSAPSSSSSSALTLDAFDYCVLPSAPPPGMPLLSPVSGGLARTVLAKWLLQDARRQVIIEFFSSQFMGLPDISL
jgi:hypothetical protein